jgi:hypothetical protein
MLQRTEATTNEDLEPITFVLSLTNGLPLNTYISMNAITNRCYNERGFRTNYVRSNFNERTTTKYVNFNVYYNEQMLQRTDATTNRCYKERGSRTNYVRSRFNERITIKYVYFNVYYNVQMLQRTRF